MVLAAFACVNITTAAAETLFEALAEAYGNSPDLNVARSTGRATDEGVGIAKSLSRPKIGATASYGWQDMSSAVGLPSNQNTSQGIQSTAASTHPYTLGVTLTQPLFTGFQAESKLKGAEMSVLAQQEQIRDTEQTVLQSTATAYADVIMTAAIVSLYAQNLHFLRDELHLTRERQAVGEANATDVANTESAYQQAVATLATAQANLASARATFMQYAGVPLRDPRPPPSLQALVPPDINQAVDAAMREHPALRAAIYNIDVAKANVAYVEGQLLPQVSLQASANHAIEPTGYLRTDTAQVGINVTVPIYQGGGEYAQIRQAKEQLGTARLQVDVTRQKLRSIVMAQWAQVSAASIGIVAARAQVDANVRALAGTMEQLKLGERSLLDVLNAQNLLTGSRVALAQNERQQAVAIFTLLQAIGRFDADHLHLATPRYDPKVHSDAVKDLWAGLRTPDGR